MRVDVDVGASGESGFWNEGFWGMNSTTMTAYTVKFYLRGNYSGDIQGAFWSNTTNAIIGNTIFHVSQSDSDEWKLYENTLVSFDSAPDGNNTFHLTFDGTRTAGTSLRFNLISVFPQTFKGNPNGLRIDLAEGVNNLGAKYLRMPGGNNMEGGGSPYRWKWNETIGPLIDRPGRPGTWGYYNTDGFGLLEMMQARFPLFPSRSREQPLIF